MSSAELCRNVHESSEWREASEVAFEALMGYLAELNTDHAMYQVSPVSCLQ
jgi:Zn-dependent oligopeptidase